MSPDDPRHGTDAGWQAHRKAGQSPCDLCAAAHRVRQREYRASNGSWRRTNAARAKALTRLARLYPEDYQSLYADELMRARQQQEAS